MSEQEIEGVRFRPSPTKKMDREYDLSDMRVVYRRGDWNSWAEMIHWLETEGERDNELTPGEVIAMVEDLRQVERDNTPFTKDPQKAYDLAHQHRARRVAGKPPGVGRGRVRRKGV
ncbi:MAG: hypothetical protein ACM3US_07920 [Sphingomonadaceae bacterium]